MIDQVRTLLLNPAGVPGYRKTVDRPSDAVAALFGLTGDDGPAVVDRLLPLVLAPDLASLRAFADPRVTPRPAPSVYGSRDSELPSGLYDRVFGATGWWAVSSLFSASDPVTAAELREYAAAAASDDAAYALGAVLLACAYRRHLLQKGGTL